MKIVGRPLLFIHRRINIFYKHELEHFYLHLNNRTKWKEVRKVKIILFHLFLFSFIEKKQLNTVLVCQHLLQWKLFEFSGHKLLHF